MPIKLSNSDKAAALNFQCRKGDSFDRTLTFSTGGGVDTITGNIFRLTVKDTKTGKVVLLFAPDCGASIVSNRLALTKTAAEMDVMLPGTYKYDLKQTLPDGKVRTRIAGDFIINA